jgi:hypothetical protein
MSLTIPQSFENAGSVQYEPIPEDNHIGILVGITDLGTHQESYQGAPPKLVRKVRFQWELPHVDRADGTKATISAKYNFSFHEKSSFRQMLDKWLGSNWHEKLKGGSLEALLGTSAMVNIVHQKFRDGSDRIYSSVSAVTKVPKGMPVPDATKDTFYLDLDTKELPAKLSLRDAEMIRMSREYVAGGFKDDAPKPGQNGNGHGYGNGKTPGTPPTTNLPTAEAMPVPDGDEPPF